MSSSGLPFLPGYTFEQSKPNYHRSQRLGVKNGVMLVDMQHSTVTARDTPSNAFLLKGKQEGAPASSGLATKAPGSDAGHAFAPTSKRPNWLGYDGKVLKFTAFFKEAVHSSPLENFRIRTVSIRYFLADGSISVTEPKVDNSGIPQGVIVKRHKVTKADGSYMTMDDLQVGTNVSLYGKVYRIVDANQFTREFYQEKGQEQPAAEAIPQDPFAKAQLEKRRDFRKKMNPLKTFMEARMGRFMGMDVASTQKFLKNDGKVLRFYCIWDDTSMYGERRPYVLRYFLADDTVEVNETQTPNSGRDPFPALLKRQKLPKDYTQTVAEVATIGHREGNTGRYYTAADMRIGAVINVFGRQIQICHCDKQTKQWYKKNMGLTDQDFPQLDMEEKKPEAPKMEVPPYNGFGTEEDSLGSCLYLVPKPPKRDFHKLMKMDGKNLRFVAKFTNPTVEDANRRFTINYSLADDTISIFEKQERNSGFVGGKFLERCKMRRDDTGSYLQPQDFAVGTVLSINSFKFTLLHADEFSLSHMEETPEQFPQANPTAIAQQMKNKGLDEQGVQRLREQFQSIDMDGSGFIDAEEFHGLMQATGYDLNEHQILTLMRKYDTNKDGKIDFNEFINAVVA